MAMKSEQPSEQSLAILIPVFNDATGLRQSLDSLLLARCPAPLMTVVVDDGSDPALTLDQGRYLSLGLKVLRLPANEGIEAALNRGLTEVMQHGIRYLARLDAGDTISPDRLTRQMALLDGNRDLGIVGSDARYVDPSGKLLFVFRAATDDPTIRSRMHVNCCLVHPTVMIRMAVLEEVGPYSVDYPAAEDYELFFRILAVAKAQCISAPLVTTVVSGSGISSRRRHAQLVSRFRIQCRNFCWTRIQAYLGVAITLSLLVVPAALVIALKRHCKVFRY
jgi:glycosyltransferase involved in cell wall biosynthesis